MILKNLFYVLLLQASLDAERFVQDILQVDPDERPSADALLKHPLQNIIFFNFWPKFRPKFKISLNVLPTFSFWTRYLSDFHCETKDGEAIDEPVRPRPLDLRDFHFDYPKLAAGGQVASERMLLDELWYEFEQDLNHPRTSAFDLAAPLPASSSAFDLAAPLPASYPAREPAWPTIRWVLFFFDNAQFSIQDRHQFSISI